MAWLSVSPATPPSYRNPAVVGFQANTNMVSASLVKMEVRGAAAGELTGPANVRF